MGYVVLELFVGGDEDVSLGITPESIAYREYSANVD